MKSNLVCFYELVKNSANGFPKLRMVKKTRAIQDAPASYENIVDILNEYYDYRNFVNEHSFVVGMSSSAHLKGFGILGIGNSEETSIDLKTAMIFLLLFGADRFVLTHNHPNGICEESESDKAVNVLAKTLASQLGLEFIEHIIVSQKEWHTMIEGETYEFKY